MALDLLDAISKRGCEIMECRIAPLGDQFSVALLVAGNWSALGKLESALPGLAEKLELQLHHVHGDGPPDASDYRPYVAEVSAPRQNALLRELLAFFHTNGVRVVEANAQAYDSGYTGGAMSNVHLALQVPMNQHPQTLRESFMDLCDELHADGMLDPIKS